MHLRAALAGLSRYRSLRLIYLIPGAASLFVLYDGAAMGLTPRQSGILIVILGLFTLISGVAIEKLLERTGPR